MSSTSSTSWRYPDIHRINGRDADTAGQCVMQVKLNVDAANERAGLGGERIQEVVADKGYRATTTLELADALSLRTYVPGP